MMSSHTQTQHSSVDEKTHDERLEDVSLCRAAAEGSAAAQHQLLDRLLDRVRRTVAYTLAFDADSEDVAQDTLLVILDSCGGFRGESSLEHWADRVTINRALRHRKKKGHRAWLFENAAAEERIPLPGTAKPISPTLRQTLATHLHRLSPERRASLILYYVYGYTVPEIAEITDVKEATVRDRLFVARKHLRKRFLADPILVHWLSRNGGPR